MSLKMAGISKDVEETGLTFLDNAILKATTYQCLSKTPTLADDSGLAVDALNGNPGVKSARYAGTNASDKQNRHKLLFELRKVPKNQRDASFVCVIAVILSSNAIEIFEGKIRGKIATKEMGYRGFGYDSVFIPDNEKQTMAQLTDDRKMKISHRGMALRKTSNWFKSSRILNEDEYEPNG